MLLPRVSDGLLKSGHVVVTWFLMDYSTLGMLLSRVSDGLLKAVLYHMFFNGLLKSGHVATTYIFDG